MCPLTGWELTLPDDTTGWSDGPSMTNASLDRIDNTKGYVRGNVRFISVTANYARGILTDEQLVAFCYAVTTYQDVVNG